VPPPQREAWAEALPQLVLAQGARLARVVLLQAVPLRAVPLQFQPLQFQPLPPALS
jgi:hypothetical protein